MSKFLFSNLNHLITLRTTASVNLASLKTHYLSYFCLQTRNFSSSSVESVENSSYRSSIVVDYLVNSCGLSPKRAILASKFVKFKVADKPDSVLTFFKDHGFNETQISKVINCFPHVLVSDPEKTLLPKLVFLKSKGLSESDIAVSLSKWPQILMRSLENQLIPSFNFFSNFLLSNGRKNIASFKRCAGVLLFDLEKHGAKNIEMLKKAGVPVKNIESLLASQPRLFMIKCRYFRQIVDEVTKMGFDPSTMNFMIAIHSLRSMTKPTWDRKIEVYKKWGWSEDDIFSAFRKYPLCMALSEDKITAVMEFLVNKMGWKSSLLSHRPTVMSYSLEKRIAPRCEVYKFLISKGLMNRTEISFASMLTFTEDRFVKRFINPHKEKAPHLLRLYKQKLDLAK